mmetsp:Transcript_28067/g.97108  ORF Transcript_28067/g.97108 Transcript_28067/m.97108 type:complete len:549 (-) Transcript_28067:76-1722(-)
MGGGRRWRALAAGLLVEAAAGTAYAFGVYSPQLKTKLGWSQTQLEAVGTYGNIGLYCGFLGGVFFDRYGTKPTLAIGVVLSFLGYAMMWAGDGDHFGAPGTVAFMGLGAAIWSHGSAWYDCATIATVAKNFPADRGRIIGLLKSLFGLSAAIAAQFYLSFFKPDAEPFLLFLAIYIAGLGVVGTLFVSEVPGEEATPLGKPGMRRAQFATTVIGVLAVFLATVAVLQSRWILDGAETASQLAASKVFSYVLIALVLLNMLVAVRRCPLWGRSDKEEPEEAYLLDYRSSSDGGPSSTIHVSFGQSLTDPNFYLIFLAVMCGTGAGLMVINNLGQMVESLGGGKGSQDVFVTLLSVFNCGGRVLAGFLSDKYSRTVIRPLWLALAVLGMGASQVLLVFSPLDLFYVAIPLVGLFYGSFWSLLPTIIADIWGTKAFGKIYSLASLAPGFGSILMAQQLAGRIYDSHYNVPGTKECTGHVCFQLTHILLAIFCAVGVAAALLVSARLRKHYAMLREGSRFSTGVRATSSVQVSAERRRASSAHRLEAAADAL